VIVTARDVDRSRVTTLIRLTDGGAAVTETRGPAAVNSVRSRAETGPAASGTRGPAAADNRRPPAEAAPAPAETSRGGDTAETPPAAAETRGAGIDDLLDGDES
jgi:hypothetical protein